MQTLSLNGQWRMTTQTGESLPCAVPGSALQTLLENGRIPDPFDGRNERSVQEALSQGYRFARSFDVPKALLEQPHVDLVFEGLDTLADITLNGTAVSHTDNMHRIWRFPVKGLLTEGENTIEVAFASAALAAQAAAKENPDITYESYEGSAGSSLIRKAHYMYGWDWGPRLPDMGIWRPVRLEGYDTRLTDVHFAQTHENGRVTLAARVQTDAECVSLRVYSPDGTLYQAVQGDPKEQLSVVIERPALWWPNGLGAQPLYRAEIGLMENGVMTEEKTFRLGLRTLTMSIELDAYGRSFALSCNGVPFFAMGADYIPEDNLLGRVKIENTRRLIEDCVKAHFNCLRVWGGGIYPDDAFFDLCDEMGIVLWQDLMFACNVYRMTDAFERSIAAEARDNLRRIRHHACLGLICGNNEMEIAWLDWDNVKHHPAALKADYLYQFEYVLRRVCREEAPELFYWPSSPSSGGAFDDPGDMNRGDVHDWSVWHGSEPFENYTKRFPRFCSEFGFESFPDMKTLARFVHSEEDMNPFSPVMEAHQKCIGGNGKMLYYLSQMLRYPFSMEQLVLDTQYIQAEAMRAGVEHWRRNRGRCMGAIYWQLNDCWPVASWSSIDSAGRWKALHYAAKRFFAPTLLSVERKGGHCRFVVSNERLEGFSGTLLWKMRSARGDVLKQGTLPAKCAPMAAETLLSCDFDGPADDRVLEFKLLDEQKRLVSEGVELFDSPKRLPLAKPHFTYTTEKKDGGTKLTITSDCLAIGVFVDIDDGRLDDNWLTLYPNEPRVLFADKPVKDVRLFSIR